MKIQFGNQYNLENHTKQGAGRLRPGTYFSFADPEQFLSGLKTQNLLLKATSQERMVAIKNPQANAVQKNINVYFQEVKLVPLKLLAAFLTGNKKIQDKLRDIKDQRFEIFWLPKSQKPEDGSVQQGNVEPVPVLLTGSDVPERVVRQLRLQDSQTAS